ncbi:MAG: peptidase [Marmoricola sp.]|nr:peptidase [Marmoricola sp.]
MLAVVVMSVAVVAPLVPNAQADNLHNRKKHVHQKIRHARTDFDDSSTALVAANRSLQAARGQLVVAQAALASTQAQVGAAETADQDAQARLTAAVSAETVAEQNLAVGTQNVVDQRGEIGRLAAADYQYGDPALLGLSAILNTQDVEGLATQLNTVDNLMQREKNLLADLKVTEAKLKAQKTAVAAAQQAVSEQRQAAAATLARKQALETQAAQNRAEVVRLVSTRAVAQQHARAIKAADVLKLKQLQKQEARIKRMILARARHHKGRGFSGNSGGFLLPPVANSYITSPYGWRIHPIYHYWGLHDGDDFHAPCGVPERASASGTVIDEYFSDVWGNRLFLDVGKVNGKDMTLIYNHISAYRSHTGEHVKRGQTVALAGTTGWSTGCHLHFTVMVNGTAVDPQKYM